jgi:hypothetical protein
MKRIAFGALALLAALAAQPTSPPAERPPSIKEIMARAHRPSGYYFAVLKGLREPAPAWDEIGVQARALSKLADALGRNAPPRGERSSWERLAAAYAANARALEEAVGRKDRPAALSAANALGEPACSTCHRAHRK